MVLRRVGGGRDGEGFASLSRDRLLRWLFIGRMALVAGILLGAFRVWGQVQPEQTLIATILFVAALVVTAGSVWWTRVLGREPGPNYLFGQVAFDTLLVTGVVHLTGGPESNFAWLYILVISEGALLLPFAGGVLIGAFASILYFADIVWGHEGSVPGSAILQITLFAIVALATGFLGDRLRRAGLALGDVQTELRRLRLDTGEILATISTGVMTLDEDGRLLYMNPAAEGLLALDRMQWEGAPVLTAVEGPSPGLAEVLRRSLTEGVTLFRAKVMATRGESVVTLGVSTTVREEAGKPRSVTAIFQDITDLERIDALNRRTERLEAVAELSASMAHEIKNPLASIRSAVEQFASPTLELADRETLIRMVVRESDRLSRLLSEFIDFARLRVGRRQRLDLRVLVRDAAAVVESHPAVEGRRLVFQEDGDSTPLHLQGDADLLHRAFFNLLLNAVQFSPEGGEVRIRMEDARERGAPPGLGVEAPIFISIRDTGPGIPEEDLPRLFDPFFSTRAGGSGLGLAVVHRAVDAHRGVVLALNGDRGGAEFNVYLPGEVVIESGEGE